MPDRSRLMWVGLAAIAAMGLWLRVSASGYGLPAVYNMDEVAIMNRALAFGTGDPNPHNFVYPTFYFYALFAWQGLTFLVGLAMGLWDSVRGFETQFFVDPSALYRSGRMLSALCGTATLIAVYRLTSRVWSAPAGLVAALLLAVAPIAVQDAQYVKHDVPVTLLIVLTHLPIARLLTGATGAEARRAVWQASALAGLAFSTHYYSVFLAVPLALAVATQTEWSWRERLTRLVQGGLLAALVVALTSPFLLLDAATAWRDITQNRAIVVDRATDTGAFPYLWRYLQMLNSQAMGWSAALALVGVLHLRRSRHLILLAFPVAFLLFIANTVPATRYLNPVLPFVAMLLAVAFGRVDFASRTRWWTWAVPVVVTGIFATAAFLDSRTLTRFFTVTDTRSQAAEWFDRTVAPGASVLIQPYSVPLRQSREGLVEALRVHVGSEEAASVKFRKILALDPYPSPAYRTIYLGSGGLDTDKRYIAPQEFEGTGDLTPLRAMGVKWVVLKQYNEPDPALAALEAALAREASRVAVFSPYRADVSDVDRAGVAPFLHNADGRWHPALERPGPIIEIWRID